MTDETLQQTTKADAILQAIADLSKKIDSYKKETDAEFEQVKKRLDTADAQSEAIRQGIVDNNIRFDRLEGHFHLLRAEVTTLVEEVRHNRKVLV